MATSDVTQEASGSRASAPSRDELIERAIALRPLIEAEAAANEERGALSTAVTDAMHEAGFFGMWMPTGLGGSELSPTDALEVIAAISYGDASTGWVLMATGVCSGSGVGYLSDDAVEALCSGDRFPMIAGQGTRPGVAVPEGDGYRISGSWSFASGIRHSGYIHTLAIIEGTGEPRIFVLPVEEGTMIDNWDVMGLRGTGSIDYTIDGAFVPEGYSHPATTETPLRGGNLYRLGIIHFAGIGHAGWALGVGRRLLDELAELAASKAGRPGQMVDSDSFHGEFAQAEARYRSARAFVFETWRDVEATFERGEDLSVRQKTLIRLALNNVTWAVHDVALFVYKSGATTALRSGTIQRFFRDANTGTQHITSGPAALQNCGRELAGLAAGQDWVFLQLIDTA